MSASQRRSTNLSRSHTDALSNERREQELSNRRVNCSNESSAEQIWDEPIKSLMKTSDKRSLNLAIRYIERISGNKGKGGRGNYGGCIYAGTGNRYDFERKIYGYDRWYYRINDRGYREIINREAKFLNSKKELFDIKQFDFYKEDNRREVKKANVGLPNDMWETYSAYANTYGGVIILGVKELDDKHWKTSGLKVTDKEKLLDNLWNILHKSQ